MCRQTADVTAGRALKGKDFDKAIEAYKEMHAKLKIELCASMGFIDAEQFRRLKEAGVTSYHHNIETSRRNFPNICTTHTFEDKIRTIKIAQKEGMCVCSGGIIGMGETWDDRIDMALTLAELGIESIPLNALMPIKGTPLQDTPQISATPRQTSAWERAAAFCRSPGRRSSAGGRPLPLPATC